MVLDGIAEESGPVPPRWLYGCADRSPFAYARGQEFIRYGDHARWARLADDQLLSMRSGACIAYRIDRVYYDATSDEPLYYVPSSFALPEHPSGEIGAVRATLNSGLSAVVSDVPT